MSLRQSKIQRARTLVSLDIPNILQQQLIITIKIMELHLINRKCFPHHQIYKIAFLVIQLTLLSQNGHAARSRIPLNNKADIVELRRSMQQQCEWVKEFEKQFCCDRELDVECEAQREWFMDDENEMAEQKKQGENAEKVNDTIGSIIQWIMIGLAAICCPLCIGVAICRCVIKKREKKAQEEELKMLEEARAHQAALRGLQNFSSSESSNSDEHSSDGAEQGDSQQRAARKEQRRLANEAYNQQVYDANRLQLQSMNSMLNQQQNNNQQQMSIQDPTKAMMGQYAESSSSEKSNSRSQQSEENGSSSRSNQSRSSSEISADLGTNAPQPPNAKPPTMSSGQHAAAIQQNGIMAGSSSRTASTLNAQKVASHQQLDPNSNTRTLGAVSALNRTGGETYDRQSGKVITEQLHDDSGTSNAMPMAMYGDTSAFTNLATNVSLKSQDGLLTAVKGSKNPSFGNSGAQNQDGNQNQFQGTNGSTNNGKLQKQRQGSDDDDLLERDEIYQIRNFLNEELDGNANETESRSRQLKIAKSANDSAQAHVKIYPKETGKSVQVENMPKQNNHPFQGSQHDIL